MNKDGLSKGLFSVKHLKKKKATSKLYQTNILSPHVIRLAPHRGVCYRNTSSKSVIHLCIGISQSTLNRRILFMP